MIPTDLPFSFKRLKFPVKVSFAVTINKAQGQTFRAGPKMYDYKVEELKKEIVNILFLVSKNISTWAKKF